MPEDIFHDKSLYFDWMYVFWISCAIVVAPNATDWTFSPLSETDLKSISLFLKPRKCLEYDLSWKSIIDNDIDTDISEW